MKGTFLDLPDLAAPAGVPSEPFEAIYHEHYTLLLRIAMQKFGMPVQEAETLVHEVFLSYLSRSGEIRDLRAWLVGAICNASRHHRRMHTRLVPLPDEIAERVDPSSARILDSLPDQLAAREALEGLTPRCIEVLRLRYFDGCTIPEIAARLRISPRYAQKLVSGCLHRAQRKYEERTRRKP
jgi:RNA polymerase sigma factor (sigma-70 family)